MRKNIATYGIVLLSTMLVVRAATMETKTDPKQLIGRNMELQVQALDNPFFRYEFESSHKPDRLISFTTVLDNLSDYRNKFKRKALSPTNTSEGFNEEINNITPIETLINSNVSTMEDADINPNALSLDHENTINTSISLRFPRQQIQARPKDL